MPPTKYFVLKIYKTYKYSWSQTTNFQLNKLKHSKLLLFKELYNYFWVYRMHRSPAF